MISPLHASPISSPRIEDTGNSTPENGILEVRGLTREFSLSSSFMSKIRGHRKVLKAVNDVTFSIPKGSTLGLVGESGCGKSTVARCVAGLMRPSLGVVSYRGEDMVNIAALRDPHGFRREVQMIFQDPYASLNPHWTIRKTLADPMLAFGLIQSGAEVREHVASLLVEVGLSAEDATKYPHQFSGGQRQRIAIARALATRPAFLICDEPTSALDVSIQAQILNLMRELQEREGLTYLFISHNLAVVDHMADFVGVMYFGRLVELRTKTQIFSQPLHPYTQMLIGVTPTVRRGGHKPVSITGELPDALNPPSGCAFHSRCPLANSRCKAEQPVLLHSMDGAVACHAVEEGRV